MVKIAYFVMYDSLKGDANWDTFCGAYEEKERAIQAARDQWNHLTRIEQKKCFVEVVSAEVPADDDDWLNEAFSIACDGAGFDSVFYVSKDGERSI